MTRHQELNAIVTHCTPPNRPTSMHLDSAHHIEGERLRYALQDGTYRVDKEQYSHLHSSILAFGV